jgi:hypothetical protein
MPDKTTAYGLYSRNPGKIHLPQSLMANSVIHALSGPGDAGIVCPNKQRRCFAIGRMFEKGRGR